MPVAITWFARPYIPKECVCNSLLKTNVKNKNNTILKLCASGRTLLCLQTHMAKADQWLTSDWVIKTLINQKAGSSNKTNCGRLQAAMEVQMTKACYIPDLARVKRVQKNFKGFGVWILIWILRLELWYLDFHLDWRAKFLYLIALIEIHNWAPPPPPPLRLCLASGKTDTNNMRARIYTFSVWTHESTALK